MTQHRKRPRPGVIDVVICVRDEDRDRRGHERSNGEDHTRMKEKWTDAVEPAAIGKLPQINRMEQGEERTRAGRSPCGFVDSPHKREEGVPSLSHTGR